MDHENKLDSTLKTPPPSVPDGESQPVDTPSGRLPASEQQLTNVEHRMSGFERSTLIWARAAVLISGLAAIFVCAQWYEMRAGAVDTHNLAVAAGNQATWTQRLAANAGTESEHMNDLAKRTKELADQAVIQATASRKLAEDASDTLANAKHSFEDEQRAWVGFQATSNGQGFTATEPWRVMVVFFNSGRTPARDVSVSLRYITSPVPLHGPPVNQVVMLRFNPVSSIAPQGYYRESVANSIGAEGSTPDQMSGQRLLISQYSQIKNKQLFLYYYGILKYIDVFGHPHETQYCIYLANPDTKQAGVCDGFNDLN